MDDQAANDRRERILLGDDNPDLREYIRSLFGNNLCVQAVTDRKAALAAARAEPPDLVLCDIMMPDLYGFVGDLHADPLLRKVPILLLAVRAGTENRTHDAANGCLNPSPALDLPGRFDARLVVALARREAEEKIRSSETELRDFVENANVGLHRVDPEGIILWANQTELDLLGYSREEYIGHSITQFHVDASVIEDILMRLRRGEKLRDCEARMRRKDGSICHVLLNSSALIENGKFIHSRCFTRDVTELKRIEQQRRELSNDLEQQVAKRTAELERANRALSQDMAERQKLEDQLRQSQKMESMGTLAAGIAHDLNNILNIIQGYSSILGQAASRDEIAESVAAITETTHRGVALVQQLLTMARKAEIRLAPTDANALISELINLIKETFPKNIELTLDLARTLPSIMADSNQMTQVLLNLCINARDAMPDGGMLALATKVVDGKALEEDSHLTAEKYVSVEITDTGTGMDEYVMSKIFEPFFTTKEIGVGTGLGLAVVYGIVKSHNGLIQVKSQPMEGTTFRLCFPVFSFGQ